MSAPLPDFEDMQKVVAEIKKAQIEKLKLEIELKEKEGNIFTTAITDKKYFQGGKPPSSTFIDNAYKHNGFEGELLPIRRKLADATVEYDDAKLRLSILQDMIEVWRTEQANNRISMGVGAF